MPLIPYKRLSISTSLGIDRATSALAGHLVTPKSSKSWFFPSYGSRDPRKFSGKRYANGFRIWRNIWSNQSTKSIGFPISYVRLREAHHGTLVNTVITLHPVQAAIGLLMIGFGVGDVYSHLKVLISTGVIESGLVTTLSFLLILYSAVMLVFNREVDLMEGFLSGIYHEHSMRA